MRQRPAHQAEDQGVRGQPHIQQEVRMRRRTSGLSIVMPDCALIFSEGLVSAEDLPPLPTAQLESADTICRPVDGPTRQRLRRAGSFTEATSRPMSSEAVATGTAAHRRTQAYETFAIPI